MELELKKAGFDAYDTGAELTLTQEETAETIVPDYCPDIARIIDGEGRIFLHRREVSGGRGEVSGVVRVTLLYVPDGEGGIRSLVFSLPFAAQADGMGDAVCLLATAELESMENRLTNPRKVFARCRLALRLRPCFPSPMRFTSDVTAPPEAGLEKRQEIQKTSLLTAVAEKDFPFTDIWTLSPGREGAAEVLSFRSEALVSECKRIGGKCLVKGIFPVSLLYRTAAGKCCRASSELPFSQILELGGEEGGTVDLCLQLCGWDCEIAPGDEEGRSFQVTLSLHAAMRRNPCPSRTARTSNPAGRASGSFSKSAWWRRLCWTSASAPAAPRRSGKGKAAASTVPAASGHCTWTRAACRWWLSAAWMLPAPWTGRRAAWWRLRPSARKSPRGAWGIVASKSAFFWNSGPGSFGRVSGPASPLPRWRRQTSRAFPPWCSGAWVRRRRCGISPSVAAAPSP